MIEECQKRKNPFVLMLVLFILLIIIGCICI
ncbi:MAG: YjcZ family sporulation protein [Erysipelotrichaceae bacterium]|nr:YjcZ family sporulation protein [Erysipelotrichaceae bacterium]